MSTARHRSVSPAAAALFVGLVLTTLVRPTPAVARPASDELRIATLPAMPNFVVQYDQLRTRTDVNGVAHFPVDPRTVHGLQQRLTVKPQVYRQNGVIFRADPARIYSENGRRLITLNVFYRVGFAFRNSNRGPLDARVIRTLKVKSSTGATPTLPAHEPVWLQGSRVVPLSGHLLVKKLYWTIQDVRYAGTNVVNASQQRFKPADTQKVSVQLLFYRAKIRVHDALFGFRRSGSMILVYPDATTARLSLDHNGSVLVPSLPRGNYKVIVEGSGPQMTQQLAISTNQNLDLKFYSWIDLTVIVGVVLFFSLGLLVIGLRRRARVRSQAVAPGAHRPRPLPSPTAPLVVPETAPEPA